KIFRDGKVRRLPGSVEIFPVECRLIRIEQRNSTENLIVERPIEPRASDAMRESAFVAPRLRENPIERLEREDSALCALFFAQYGRCIEIGRDKHGVPCNVKRG